MVKSFMIIRGVTVRAGPESQLITCVTIVASFVTTVNIEGVFVKRVDSFMHASGFSKLRTGAPRFESDEREKTDASYTAGPW
jgi:hypothetical protein